MAKLFVLMLLVALSGVFAEDAETDVELDQDTKDLIQDINEMVDLYDVLTDEDFEAGSKMTDEELNQGTVQCGKNVKEEDVEQPTKEASVSHKENMWPDGKVYYVIEKGQFNEQDKRTIARAMDEYKKQTCLRWVPVEKGYNGQFVRITRGNDCFSMIGRIPGNQGQKLHLGPGCLYGIGTALHEMMHAIGFEHEQNRIDRDNYVRILMDNVKPDEQFNYKKASPGSRKDLFSYDFESIMHYYNGEFGKKDQNGREMKTMEPLKGDKNRKMGNKYFSDLDLKKINTLYNCNK